MLKVSSNNLNLKINPANAAKPRQAAPAGQEAGPTSLKSIANPALLKVYFAGNAGVETEEPGWRGKPPKEVMNAILATREQKSGQPPPKLPDLSGYDFSGADLSGTDLSYTDLSYTDLIRANLTRANLTDANLTKAYLHQVSLHKTKLQGAKLKGAYLFLMPRELDRSQPDRRQPDKSHI